MKIACTPVPARPLFAVMGLCLAFTLHATAQADESGTLVMVAKSPSVVYIAVDSHVVSNEGGGSYYPAAPIAGDRKLVLVGHNSACAIAGFLGRNSPSLDVATSLRAWVIHNPDADAHAAVIALLGVVSEVWERQGYGAHNLPNRRTKGSLITALTCGDFIARKPIIVQGEIYVGEGGSARIEVPTADPQAPLYVEGVLNTDVLAMIFGDTSELQRSSDYPFLRAVGDRMRLDSEAQRIYEKWASGRLSHSGSVLLEPDIEKLFRITFADVENLLPGSVAPPNNLIIIGRCGRIVSDVDVKAWPLCLPRTTSPAK